jgi:drug/metabolite transporter (DMT)-like permease
LVLARFLLASLVLMPFLRPLLRHPRSAALLLGSGAGMAIGTYGYGIGIRDMAVSLAALIFFSFPLFVILYQLLFLRRLPSLRESLILLLVLVAVGLAVGGVPQGDLNLRSLGLTFLGPAAYAAVLMAMSLRPSRLSPLTAAAGFVTGGLLVALPLLLLEGGRLPVPQSGDGVWGVIGLAVLVGLLPTVLLAHGSRSAGPVRTSIAGAIELPVSLLVGLIAFQEQLAPLQMAGVAILLLAVALTVFATPRVETS